MLSKLNLDECITFQLTGGLTNEPVFGSSIVTFTYVRFNHNKWKQYTIIKENNMLLTLISTST